MWHASRGEKVYKVLVGMPVERDHSEERDVDGSRMDLMDIGWGVWS
jgi:hypothetical protein